MGNLCSKSANKASSPSVAPTSDPFARPGRTLSSADHQRAPVPKSAASKGQGRVLGGEGAGGGGVNAGGGNIMIGGGGGGSAEDARRAAARAAEERAAAAGTGARKGKLGQQLAREKGRTGTGTLEAASREERRRREVEGVEGARAWD